MDKQLDPKFWSGKMMNNTDQPIIVTRKDGRLIIIEPSCFLTERDIEIGIVSARFVDGKE